MYMHHSSHQDMRTSPKFRNSEPIPQAPYALGTTSLLKWNLTMSKGK